MLRNLNIDEISSGSFSVWSERTKTTVENRLTEIGVRLRNHLFENVAREPDFDFTEWLLSQTHAATLTQAYSRVLTWPEGVEPWYPGLLHRLSAEIDEMLPIELDVRPQIVT